MSELWIYLLESSSEKVTYDVVANQYDSRWEAYLNNTHYRAQELLPTNPGEVLDVSGGTGIFASRINATVVDNSPGMLKEARKKGLRAIRGDVHNLPFNDCSFDTLTCLSAFHHYARPSQAVREMWRVLKPKGTVVLLDWRRSWWFLPYEYLKRLEPEHVQSYTLGEIKDLFSGWSIEKECVWRQGFWPLMALRMKR